MSFANDSQLLLHVRAFFCGDERATLNIDRRCTQWCLGIRVFTGESERNADETIDIVGLSPWPVQTECAGAIFREAMLIKMVSSMLIPEIAQPNLL